MLTLHLGSTTMESVGTQMSKEAESEKRGLRNKEKEWALVHMIQTVQMDKRSLRFLISTWEHRLADRILLPKEVMLTLRRVSMMMESGGTPMSKEEELVRSALKRLVTVWDLVPTHLNVPMLLRSQRLPI